MQIFKDFRGIEVKVSSHPDAISRILSDASCVITLPDWANRFKGKKSAPVEIYVRFEDQSSLKYSSVKVSNGEVVGYGFKQTGLEAKNYRNVKNVFQQFDINEKYSHYFI